jgi:hypothetical protein
MEQGPNSDSVKPSSDSPRFIESEACSLGYTETQKPIFVRHYTGQLFGQTAEIVAKQAICFIFTKRTVTHINIEKAIISTKYFTLHVSNFNNTSEQ